MLESAAEGAPEQGTFPLCGAGDLLSGRRQRQKTGFCARMKLNVLICTTEAVKTEFFPPQCSKAEPD